MSPPLNTSYTDSSHTVPHTSPDREESSRPIERPEVVQSSQGGREAKMDQSVVGKGTTWASRGALNSGPWGHQARGNSAGLRVRQAEEQQVFRASAKWPHGLNQAAAPAQSRVSESVDSGSPVHLDSFRTQKKYQRPLNCVFLALSPFERTVTLRLIGLSHFVEGRAGPVIPFYKWKT